MRIMAQVCMVMNLDKCIGCHTCTVTCKQTWTNRPGTEYVYFNNVETKPGLGYPARYEDQEQWHGGWALDRKGRLTLKSGSRLKRLLSIFCNPDLPTIEDYHEPYTYDYARLITAPAGTKAPSVSTRSALTGREPSDLGGQFASYGELKEAVAEQLVKAIAPIRERYEELRHDRPHLEEMLEVGRERAEKIAAKTIEAVYQRVGLLGWR
jgi:nitrate reductase beta subunit